jgi:cysteine synthase A
VGSGGTLIGVGKTLKNKNKDVKIYAVKPTQDDIGIEGINEKFVPEIVEDNIDLIADWLYVSRSEAIKMSKRLIREEGVFAGISSGANVQAALTLLKKSNFRKIVTVLPDSADRYLDSNLFK